MEANRSTLEDLFAGENGASAGAGVGEGHRKVFVYVLPCEGARFYVGTTDNPRRRLQDHRDGGGSQFTSTYPPVGGYAKLRLVVGTPGIDEDKEVLEQMKKHGIHKVRGGSYSQLELDALTVQNLTRQIRHADGVCLRCGHPSHWGAECYSQRDVDGNAIGRTGSSGGEHPAKKMTPTHARGTEVCRRCWREGHYVKDCYASTHARGYRLSDRGGGREGDEEDEDCSDAYDEEDEDCSDAYDSDGY